jgi:hypothetical protein
VAQIRLLSTMRTMSAVYWPPLTDEQGNALPDERGRPTFDAPELLYPETGDGVFWLDKGALVEAPGGFQELSKARVFVGRDLTRGGVLFKGRMEDVPQGYETDPLGIRQDAALITDFTKTPTLNPGEFVRVATL